MEYDVLLYKTGNLSQKTNLVVKRQCGQIKSFICHGEKTETNPSLGTLGKTLSTP